jgi:peptidoglycan/xylan/chitin deacetylase (PgdA/CDA1 family)
MQEESKTWRVRWYHIVSAVLLVLVLVPLSPLYPAKVCKSQGSPTLVVLTFDDGYSSWISTIMPILNRYDLPASGFINDPDELEGFTWADAQELYDAGWEIGWHTKKHISLDVATRSDIISDFEESRVLFESHGLPSPVTFAYPHGRHNPNSMEIASEYFLAARTTQYGINSACSVRENPASLKTICLSFDTSFLEDTVNKYSQQGVLLVFYGHAIGPDPDWLRQPEMDAQQFENFANFLYKGEQKGNIEVVTFSEGVYLIQQKDAASCWSLKLDSPFDPPHEVHGVPIPGRYFELYDGIVHEWIGYRYPHVARFLDDVVYSPNRIGFVLVAFVVIAFIVVSIVLTVINVRRNRT